MLTGLQPEFVVDVGSVVYDGLLGHPEPAGDGAALLRPSAIHASRPLARRGETWIALTFGLMHGLAFAALLGQLDLSRGSLVTTLLGVNLVSN